MRWSHLDTFRPICPVCWYSRGERAPLVVGLELQRQDQGLHHGILHCTNPACLCEFPVIDGLPILPPGPRSYLAENLLALLARQDLPAELESLLGDCSGPGSPFVTQRQQLSCYAWDHYGDVSIPCLDAAALGPLSSFPPPPKEARNTNTSGALLRLFEHLQPDLADLPPGPILEVGCSVGRLTFALTERYQRLTLGLDLNAEMLRLAQQLLQHGEAVFPLRRVGLVHDQMRITFPASRKELVDFWLADGLALPLPDRTFAAVVCVNVLDCVSAPYRLLQELTRVLAPAGRLVLAAPYDWSISATPVEGWLGGHSQRGPHGGASETLLRALLTPGCYRQSLPDLTIVRETLHFPWQVRLHERSVMIYDLHIIVAQRQG